MKHYVYKITFEEVPHFYIGVRSNPDPDNDPYLGSPKTHRSYWDIYTPKKQILWVFTSRDEACDVETALILQNWGNRYCLNASCARAIHPSVSVVNAKRLNSRKRGDPQLYKKWREETTKGVKLYHERRRKDPALYHRCEEAYSRNIADYNNRRKEDPSLDQEHRNRCKSLGRITGKGNSGRRWIHKNGETRAVLPEDLENFLSNGWKLGRKIQ